MLGEKSRHPEIFKYWSEMTEIFTYPTCVITKLVSSVWLVFGEKSTMKRRIGRNQVKGVVTCMYQNHSDGSIQYDIAPTQGASHLRVSEFDVVKSAGDTYSRATQKDIDQANLNGSNS